MSTIACYSQEKLTVKDVLRDFETFQIDSAETESLFEGESAVVIGTLKKKLPRHKIRPFMTKDEAKIWIRGADSRAMQRVKPRILSGIYSYKDYYIIRYYISLGRFSVSKTAVVAWNNNKIMICIILSNHFSIMKKPHNSFRKCGKRVFVEKSEGTFNEW